MRRFTLAVVTYSVACLLVIAAILVHGYGPTPRIVGLYPPSSDLYWPGGQAQITFSQEMDQASVERALRVSPASQGQGAWYGNTLNLQPLGGWKPNVTYRLVLQGKVTDTQGRTLQTPASFWFRVHHVGRLAFCEVKHVRNVCEQMPSRKRPLTRSDTPIIQFALSRDGTSLAYTRRDGSGLAHLFLSSLDGLSTTQLTYGKSYADSNPTWVPGSYDQISYNRRPVLAASPHPRLGRVQLWNVQIDGSANVHLVG